MSDFSFDRPLLLLGCGNMAGAMLTRWLAVGLDPGQVQVVRPSGKAVAPGVQVSVEIPQSIADRTMVMLGFKPAQLPAIAPTICSALAGRPVLSILAGLTIESLSTALPGCGPLVRLMPNLPVAIGEGVTALHAADGLDPSVKQDVDTLVAPLGLGEWIVNEADFDLVTALSGCGPAFVYRFIDTLAAAASDLGLPADQALRLAKATVAGGAAVASWSAQSPSALADAVASPGGMTREGLNVLDAEDRLLILMRDVLRAARDRGQELNRSR